MKRDAYARLQEVAGPVSRETYEKLIAFETVFRRWAQRINLVAPSTLVDAWERHILDSAQVTKLGGAAQKWLDIGSGGGFPGLVIASMIAERSGATIDLVESNRKKAGFLQAVVGELKLPARVHAKRIEDVQKAISGPDILSARALAPLPLLLELSAPWLASGTVALFHKGRDYRQEIEDSAHQWRFDLVEHPSLTDAQGVILEIRNLRRI
ncbi:16S rRNA (guanine(527)-N(7))-methyltransferase RsmG [Aminobacter sp. HY435]|uniref:16S rRNA (guanine(527)-N(7))-methyltransferase RsmG n=1 Tax=Aminobacter sp. HY435 TaxID=2970917 RepID=UPI0022B94DBB|nr:16S rRNA (guanine(527)-N(7))-methyltransferase RsmG [Aminobacter sp. HY435]